MMTAFVVDDDPDLADLVAYWLQGLGYRVQQSLDFADARNRLASQQLDLLVVDIRLRGFNGLQLALTTRQAQPHLAIVVMSGWDDPVLRWDIEDCAAQFIQKPLSLEGVLAAVERANDLVRTTIRRTS